MSFRSDRSCVAGIGNGGLVGAEVESSGALITGLLVFVGAPDLAANVEGVPALGPEPVIYDSDAERVISVGGFRVSPAGYGIQSVKVQVWEDCYC